MATPYIALVPSRKASAGYATDGITSVAHANRVQSVLRELARQGLFFTSAGVPSGGDGVQPLSICLDTSNDHFYVYNAGAWVKVTTS